jgi:putative serine protease PepD
VDAATPVESVTDVDAPVASATHDTVVTPLGEAAPGAAASTDDVWASAPAPAAAAAAPAPAEAPAAAAAFGDTLQLPTDPAAVPAFPADPYGTGQGPTGLPPYAEPAPTRRRGPRLGLLVALAVVLSLLAGLLGGALGFALADRVDDNNPVDPSVVLTQSEAGESVRPSNSIAGIASTALPAVVSIAVSGPSGDGTGSGFILRADGYILTNNHVIESAAGGGEIVVNFNDGSKADATIVGRDPAYDLAVIKVDKTGLPVLPLGNSDNVVVGDAVVAVGSPLGLSGTVTAGIVSALDRPVTAGGSGSSETSFINAIQTDAAINPGNSGGPLLNAAGRVIGINSAIATLGGSESQTGSIGVGFAIPVNQAKITAEQIIQTGTSTKPVIGVTVDLAYTGPGARVSVTNPDGATGVVEGGPADQAGIQPGDIILEVNGRTVNGADEFIVAIRAQQPGDVVELTVQRNGQESTVKVTLGEETTGN